MIKSCGGNRYVTGLMMFAGANLGLTLIASVLCVCFAPTAAGPGIPEIKAYLNGIDTPNMFGATTMFVKVCFWICLSFEKDYQESILTVIYVMN